MARILMAGAAALVILAANAFAQSSAPAPDPGVEPAPLEPMGPIVNGKHIQPSLSDIMEREAQKQPPGEPGAAPPARGSSTSDKELDELYDEVLKQSQPQP
jgi:hypothetical protein